MKTKKIIAREFLFLLAVPIIGLIIAFYYGAKRSYYGSKIEKQKENLTELKLKYQDLKSVDLVNRINGIDQKYLTEYVADRDNGESCNYPEYITEKVLQSIYDYYASIYYDRDSLDFRIETDIKFPEFFLIQKSLQDSVLAFQKEREPIKKNLELLESKYKYSDGDWEAIWIGLFLTLFGLRYLIYATIWAIKTLRTKEA